jgi:hypothetical protein
MNTPSHAILNLALLMQVQPEAVAPIVCGAVLPDVPMFVMYLWAKYARQQSEQQIWEGIYWTPFWQRINHGFHSIPFQMCGVLLCHWAGWPLAEFLFWSAVFHALGDLPIHNHDAHRHFLPLSNYRFISPLSYWDPQHHGKTVALVEKVLVLGATIYLWPQVDQWLQGLMVVFNVTYWTGYFYRVVFQRCAVLPTTPPLDRAEAEGIG